MPDSPATDPAAGLPKALVLKGGGVKGLALIGAVRTLEEYGYSFDVYAGTSAGAIVACLYAAGYTSKDLETFLREKDFEDFKDRGFLRLLWNLVAHRGMHSGEPFERWLTGLLAAKHKDLDKVRMKDLAKRAIVFATQKDRGVLVFDSRGAEKKSPVVFAVRCSMSIPGFFVPESHEGEPVYDGGLLANFPLDDFQRAAKEHRDSFIGLYLVPDDDDGGKPGSTGGLFSLLRDVAEILLEGDEARAVEEYREQTIRIKPSPVSTTAFDLGRDEKDFLVARGKAAALGFLARKGHASAAKAEPAASRHADELREKILPHARRRKRRARLAFIAVPAAALLMFIGSIVAVVAGVTALRSESAAVVRFEAGGACPDGLDNVEAAIEFDEGPEARVPIDRLCRASYARRAEAGIVSISLAGDSPFVVEDPFGGHTVEGEDLVVQVVTAAGRPRSRLALHYTTEGTSEDFGVFRGVLEDKLESVKEQLRAEQEIVSKEVANRQLNGLALSVAAGGRPGDDAERRDYLKRMHSLGLLSGAAVRDEGGATRFQSRIYLEDEGAPVWSFGLTTRLSGDEFGRARDGHVAAFMYALAVEARRLEAPNDLVMAYLSQAHELLVERDDSDSLRRKIESVVEEIKEEEARG